MSGDWLADAVFDRLQGATVVLGSGLGLDGSTVKDDVLVVAGFGYAVLALAG